MIIELVLSNKVDDLLRREADIAVRMLRPSQDALVAKRVGGVELGLHAHELYLQEHGVPKSMDELSGHAVIGFDHENAFIRTLQGQFPAFSRDAFAFRSDSDLANLAAIRAGFGVGVCQSALAARDKALVRVLKDQVFDDDGHLDRDARGPAREPALCGDFRGAGGGA